MDTTAGRFPVITISTTQIVLLVTGITMIGYGAVRGEAAVVLGKAIKLCLECVGIG